MADPTTGPLGTAAGLFDLTGTDQSAYAGMTLDLSGSDVDFRLLTNKLAAGLAAVTRAFKNGTPNPTYGPDCEIWFRLDAWTTTVGHGLWATVRWQNPTVSASASFLQAGMEVVTGPANNLTSYQKNSGSTSAVGTFASAVTITAGDFWAFTFEGSAAPVTLKAWKWDGVSSWVQQGSSLTTSPTGTDLYSAGLVGFEADDNGGTIRFSAVGGGTKVTAGSSPPPPPLIMAPRIST